MKNISKAGASVKFALIAALGGFLFGYDTAVINGAIGPLSDFFGLTPGEKGWAASSALVGCVIGSASAGFFAGRFGRKKNLMITAVLFFISALGCAVPQNLEQLVLFRILGGIAVGAASMTAPMYIAELSPPAVRGRLVSYYQLAVVIGILIVFFVNYFIAESGSRQWVDEAGWRWMFASESIPAAMFFTLLFFAPESPRWLVMKNRITEAFRILESIRNNKAERELKEIRDSLAFEKGSAKTGIFQKGIFRIVLIGILLSFFQQVTGINVIMYYGTEIFKGMGSGINAALFQTILVGAVNLIFTIAAIKTIDKFGRKPITIIGCSGMAAGILSLGFHIYFKSFGLTALISVLVFIGSFAMSLGPVVWVLISEIFPNRIRNAAMPIAVAAQWISNFLVTQTFPMLSESPALKSFSNGAFPFWIYGLMCFAAVFFTIKFVPETKGKTLEEMEEVFGIPQKF